MRHYLHRILLLVFIVLNSLSFAQEKAAQTPAADSSGVLTKAFSEFSAHSPQIDWYLILLDLIWILLILILGYIVSRYVLQPLRVVAARNRKRAAVLTRFVFTIQILVWLSVLYLLLFKVIRVSQITEAIIGATIGLALLVAGRDLLINLMAGIRIALTKIPRTGDRIKIEDMQGTIEKIGLISTTIRLANNLSGLVPNRLFLQKPVRELVAAETYAPVQVNFFFPADGDFIKIREIAERAASLSKYIYLSNPISIKLENIFREGRSLVHLQLNACVLDPGFETEFRSEISEQVLGEIFRQELITSDQMNF